VELPAPGLLSKAVQHVYPLCRGPTPLGCGPGPNALVAAGGNASGTVLIGLGKGVLCASEQPPPWPASPHDPADGGTRSGPADAAGHRVSTTKAR